MTLRNYIVTLKKYQKEHDPKNKRVGECITSLTCTDNTGHHHSTLIQASDIQEVKRIVKSLYDLHITRIEEVNK